MTVAELKRRLSSQTRQICYAKVRALDRGGRRGVTLAHGQDIWIDLLENHEFPDSPEPTEPPQGAHSSYLRVALPLAFYEVSR